MLSVLFGNYVHFLLSSKPPLIFLEKFICSLQEFPILLFGGTKSQPRTLIYRTHELASWEE